MVEEIILRDWQKHAFEKFHKGDYNGVLHVATGKGKTIFGIHCIKELMKENLNLRTAIIVPTINLLKQWEKELNKFLNIDIGDIGLFYGKEKSHGSKITIFVINSAIKEEGIKKEHEKRSYQKDISKR